MWTLRSAKCNTCLETSLQVIGSPGQRSGSVRVGSGVTVLYVCTVVYLHSQRAGRLNLDLFFMGLLDVKENAQQYEHDETDTRLHD